MAKANAFWDTPVGKTMAEPGQGGAFCNGAEKQALIDSGATFPIKNVVLTPETQFGPQYYVYIDFPDVATGDVEERILAFGSDSKVESRNRQLAAMADYFENDGEPFNAQLVKIGRSQLLRKAD